MEILTSEGGRSSMTCWYGKKIKKNETSKGIKNYLKKAVSVFLSPISILREFMQVCGPAMQAEQGYVHTKQKEGVYVLFWGVQVLKALVKPLQRKISTGEMQDKTMSRTVLE